MDNKIFKSFFKTHSQNVDNANTQGFWKLTDNIIEKYLLENMPKRNNVTIVDFGGGTGKWLLKLDKYFTNSHFILVDLSEDMLDQAKKKITDGLFKNRIEIVKSDIARINNLKSNSVDYIISTYNPLSFCDDPQIVINEAYRILKPHGTAMITVQGYYNAMYSKINNFLAPEKEINGIHKEKKVKWNPSVPKLWQLSMEDMEEMFQKSKFAKISSRGIACIIQPQNEDFDPENKQLSKLSKKLTDENYFQTILEIELKSGSNPSVVNRGMNIMTIGIK